MHHNHVMNATILVVDDDPVTLTLVERTLRGGGYRVWTAGGAAEARGLLEDLAGAVDLVLTDIAMPGGLGTDLARQIGSTQRWVRVLLMTSYWREDLESQGLEVPGVSPAAEAVRPGTAPLSDPRSARDVTAPLF